MQAAEHATLGMEPKDKYLCRFVMYYIMTLRCFKESGLHSCDNDSDGDNNTNLEISKLSKVLSAIKVGRCYITVKSCRAKALNSLTSLQNEVNAFNARKVKQVILSNFLKADKVQNNISFVNIFVNTFKYHVFAPMGRFQLELIYLYSPLSFHLRVDCFCPAGLSLL